MAALPEALEHSMAAAGVKNGLGEALQANMGLNNEGVPLTMLQSMSEEAAIVLLEAAQRHGVPPTTMSTLYGVAEIERQFEAAHDGNVLTFDPVWSFVANEVARTALVTRHGYDTVAASVQRVRSARALSGAGALAHLPACDLFNISCDIKRVFDEHLPLLDGDNDYFADSLYQLRGASWRGKDCNDKDATIYPGRATNNHGPSVDHNCNGISGVNATGCSYEQSFCSGDNTPVGVGILGDSATAHFHIPPQLLNARNVLKIEGALDRIIALVTNEADWPQCSWSTAFRGSAECPSTPSDLSLETHPSIYQRMLERNKCAHRDLQNTGVNGARVGSMSASDGIMYSLARNQTTDNPMLLFWALIG
jgi:acyloxyacyl hydrolase